jgi:hypothetical protein
MIGSRAEDYSPNLIGGTSPIAHILNGCFGVVQFFRHANDGFFASSWSRKNIDVRFVSGLRNKVEL